MADRDPRNRAIAASGAPLPAAPEPAPAPPSVCDEDAPDPPFDPAAFDPAEFEWRPVARRPRADGWSPDVQRAFIQALADTGLVEHAARAVDMSVQSAYRLRRAPGGEGFARAWNAALAAAAERVLDLAFTRAIAGEEVPVFDRDGCRIGAKWRTNDRLTMFILRAYLPDRFRHAHRDTLRPDERGPARAVPVADALAALSPPVPADPHLLVPPDRLADMVEGQRAVAAFLAGCPADDERRRYVPVPVEADRPAATDCARTRRRRACDREAPDDEAGYGDD